MAPGTLEQASKFPPWSITPLVFDKNVPPNKVWWNNPRGEEPPDQQVG